MRSDFETRRSMVDRADRDRRDRQSQQEDVICEAERRVILRSSNGAYFSIGVNNDGTLTTTYIGDSLR